MANPATALNCLYLSEPDMVRAGVTDMTACVDTMVEVFKLLSVGDYRMAGALNNSHGAMVIFPDHPVFENMPKAGTDRRFMAMPAYLGGAFHKAGVKWYGSNMDNRKKGLPRSILTFILNDPDTGAPLAFMSANLLSAYRTGAVCGVGAKYLAREDATSVGLLGPGVMGKTVLSAIMSVRPKINTIKIKGRGQKSLDDFIRWLEKTYPQISHIQIVATTASVVRDSDIVTFCNSSGKLGSSLENYPHIKREWVKEGAFIVLPSATTIDTELEKADVLKAVDNTGLYEAWFAEVPKPAFPNLPIIGVHFMDLIAAGKMAKEDLRDIGHIILGNAPGRENESQIAIMSVGGMPVEDVGWATTIYRQAKQRGIGKTLHLWDEPLLA